MLHALRSPVVTALGAALAGALCVTACHREVDCQKACAIYGDCVKRLQDEMRVRLDIRREDLGDLGAKIDEAVGRALDEDRERCERECAASGDVAREVAECAAEDCVSVTMCMPDALPEHPRERTGPHTCMHASLCEHYRGRRSTRSTVRAVCAGLGGQYRDEPCPTDGLLGTCIVDRGKDEETVTYRYARGSESVESAKALCLGEFSRGPAARANRVPDARPAASGEAPAGAPPAAAVDAGR